MTLEDMLGLTFAGNTVQQYLIALGVFLAAIIVLRIFKYSIITRLKKSITKTKNDIDDLVLTIADNFGFVVYTLIALYIAILFIQTPSIITTILNFLLIIFVTYYTVLGVQDIINYAIKKVIKRRQKEDEHTDSSAIEFLGKLLKAIIWVMAALLILSNLGYNISTLIAGLGIGGIAIAFALQNVLTDIFASISIYFDKPFKVGDFIVLGNDSGVVKRIGIKTTRIQTLQGEELVVSNKELTETKVHNYKKMDERRVVFTFGITYETNNQKLQKIPGIVEDIIKKQKKAKFDRTHFKNFGDSALNYEVVYFLKSTEYALFMDTQQAINLELKKQFEKAKIDMAYPTRTVYLKK